MQKSNLPIGVFDSGVGGITVLAEMVRLLPNERFLYFGDNLHAPYGTKSTDTVKKLTLDASNFLIGQGIKALVIACNTATSAAASEVRAKFNIPILGMEPALRPAVKLHPAGKIVVMATPLTLREKKFQNLLVQCHVDADIIPLACPGLVELIENGDLHGKKIRGYLDDLFSGTDAKQIAAIVLGCTHYLFIKDEIAARVGTGVIIMDGNYGTTKHLERTLSQQNLLAEQRTLEHPIVKFFTTATNETIVKYQCFYDYALKNIYPE